RERGGLELAGHVRGAGGIEVVDPDELRVGQAAQQSRVVIGQGPGANDAHAHRAGAHTSTPRWLASMKRRKASTSGSGGSSLRARAMPWLTVRSELNSN